jgi:hypothetical protein
MGQIYVGTAGSTSWRIGFCFFSSRVRFLWENHKSTCDDEPRKPYRISAAGLSFE